MDTDPGAGDDDEVYIDAEGLGVLSRSAFQLHGFALVNSFEDGTPGFVSDDYLNAITAEPTTPAMELVTAGIWERRPGGYFIVEDTLVKDLIDHNERMAERAAQCLGRHRHLPSPPAGKWVVCEHCGVPLQRPDGGPTAQPNGGPLGPDPRSTDLA